MRYSMLSKQITKFAAGDIKPDFVYVRFVLPGDVSASHNDQFRPTC